MAIDFSTLVYLPAQDVFGRNATFTPVKSNPSGGSYVMRGIFSTRSSDVFTEMGVSVLSDQETIFDIRTVEFIDNGYALPQQGDRLTIPAEGNIPAEGDFEVTDTSVNGGGEMTLVIRKYEAAAP